MIENFSAGFKIKSAGPILAPQKRPRERSFLKKNSEARIQKRMSCPEI
jgi:hypothetical protein